MIGTRVSWMLPRGALLVLFLVVILSSPDLAEAGNPPPGESLGADSVQQRVRERGRMQAEYEVIREERRLALAEARESVAAASSGEGENARNPAVIRTLAGSREGNNGGAAREGKPDGASADGEAGTGFRDFLVCAIFVMLSVALYLKFHTNR